MSDMDETTRQLRNAVRRFVRLFGLLDEHRTPCGEPLRVPHAHALMILHERTDERPPRISELGANLSVDKANVSRLCNRMQEQGHVELRPCPNDGRAKRVHLTDEGERVAARVDGSSLEQFERILAALEATEPGEVVGALEALNEAIVDMESTTEEPQDE